MAKQSIVESHFKCAKKIINSWPKWKQEVGIGFPPLRRNKKTIEELEQ